MARVITLGTLVTRCQQRRNFESSGLIGVADTSEWKALVSTAYGELYGELVQTGARYFERIRTITTIAATNATGTLTCDTKANMTDGELFALDDGYGELIFEIDKTGDGVTAGYIQCDISGDTTADDVGATLETAINAATHDDGTAIAITAANTSGVITLTHDETGEIGNRTQWESSASTTFALTDMTGGGQTYRIPADHLTTVGVYYVPSSTQQWVPLEQRMAQEYGRGTASAGSTADSYCIHDSFIRLTPFPAAGQTYKLIYVPQNPDLTNFTNSYKLDVVTPAGEEFIIAHVSINALSKEDSDAAIPGLVATRERMREQIREWGTNRALYELKAPMVDDQLLVPGDDGDWRFGMGGL